MPAGVVGWSLLSPRNCDLIKLKCLVACIICPSNGEIRETEQTSSPQLNTRRRMLACLQRGIGARLQLTLRSPVWPYVTESVAERYRCVLEHGVHTMVTSGV